MMSKSDDPGPVVSGPHARRIHQTYQLHALSPDLGSYTPDGPVRTVRIEGGKVFLDDVPVLEPRFGRSTITWGEQTDRHFTSGTLYLRRGGVEVQGTICLGKTPADATPHVVIGATLSPTRYATQITGARHTGKEPDRWSTGLDLSIGFEAGSTKVLLGDTDISSYVVWGIDAATDRTVLSFEVDPGECLWDGALYLAGRIAFDAKTVLPTFDGQVTSTCADREGTGAYSWRGNALAQASAPPRKTASLAEAAAAPVLSAAGSTLSVEELMNLVPTDEVTSVSNDMLVRNMKWAMGEDHTQKQWLTTFFGEQQPYLTDREQTIVKTDLGWYQDYFSKAYLSWCFANYSGPNEPSVKLSSDEKATLQSYLQTGIATQAGFTTQQNGVYLDAYVTAVPRLKAYIDNGGGRWAKKLYDEVLTTESQLSLMVNRVRSCQGDPDATLPMNNNATELTALDPSAELARDYVELVTASVLLSMYDDIAPNDAGGIDEYMEWFPDWLQAFTDRLALDGTDPELVAQIQQLVEVSGGMVAAAQEICAFIAAAAGDSWTERCHNAEMAWQKKYPKLTKVGNALFLFGFSIAVLGTLRAFMNWKDLDPEARTKAIISSVGVAAAAIEAVPQVIEGVMNLGKAGLDKFKKFCASRATGESVAGMGRTLNEGIVEGGSSSWVVRGAEESRPLFEGAPKGEPKTTGTRWERLTKGKKVANKVVGAIGAVVAVAVAVMSVYDFAKDIKEGQPISKIVLDGLLMAANIGIAVCACVGLFVASTVCAIVGAVLAIVGFVIQIIARFVVKPKNPLDDFMKDVAKPFVATLRKEFGALPPPPIPVVEPLF